MTGYIGPVSLIESSWS